MFCDTFGDGLLAADWTYLKPAWSETGGTLIGSATQKAAIAIARRAFEGCDVCSIRVTLESAGGPRNKVSVLTHYVNKKNYVEAILSEETDKIIIKQRLNGKVVAKAKASVILEPNIRYDVLLSYDGSVLVLSFDGLPVLTLEPAGSLPLGTVGLKAIFTTASFGEIRVD